MPYTAPTTADLKARYPAFAAVADVVVEAVLADTFIDVGESWIEAHRAPAMLALAAHWLQTQGANASAESVMLTGGIGTVTEMRAGDTSLKFANPSDAGNGAGTGTGSASAFSSTPYGRRFLELRSRSFPAVLVV